MTNSISTTVVEVARNIHDTVIMASWQPMSKPTTWQFNFILCQVVKTSQTLSFKMSLLSERHLMTVVINMH